MNLCEPSRSNVSRDLVGFSHLESCLASLSKSCPEYSSVFQKIFSPGSSGLLPRFLRVCKYPSICPLEKKKVGIELVFEIYHTSISQSKKMIETAVYNRSKHIGIFVPMLSTEIKRVLLLSSQLLCQVSSDKHTSHPLQKIYSNAHIIK